MVTREPEWDDYARAEAIADLLYERRCCKNCGALDSFVPEPVRHKDIEFRDGMPFQWDDGRVFVVRQFRCIGCGALDVVRRDTHEANKDHKHQIGRFSPEDGLRMTVDERR